MAVGRSKESACKITKKKTWGIEEDEHLGVEEDETLLSNAAKISIFKGDPSEYPMFKETFQIVFPEGCASDRMLITQLWEYLAPDVRLRVVECKCECFKGHKSYSFVWERMDDEFGDSIVSSQEYFNDLLDFPAIKPGENQTLKNFALTLHTAVAGLVGDGLEKRELESGCHLNRLEAKLPFQLLRSWTEYTMKKRIEPSIADLDDWLTVE